MEFNRIIKLLRKERGITQKQAAEDLKQIAKSGKKILFVATKKQAKDVVAAKAASVNMPYVIERWPGGMLYSAETGKKYTLRYVIDEQGLNDAIGLELVSIKTGKDGEEHIFSKREFEVVAHEGNNYTFEATFEPDVAGSFKSCVRMYPKNENLVYREDFCYVKWLD